MKTKHGILLSLVLLNPNFSFTDDSAALLPVTEGIQVQNKKFLPNPMRCSILEAGLVSQNWRWISKSHPNDIERNTEGTIYLETSEANCLNDFIVLNFKKGCAAETWIREGKSESQIVEDHKNWIVDGTKSDLTNADSISLKLKPKDLNLNLTHTSQWLRRLQNNQNTLQEVNSRFAFANLSSPSTLERNFGTIGSHKLENNFSYKSCIAHKDTPDQFVTCFEWQNKSAKQGNLNCGI